MKFNYDRNGIKYELERLEEDDLFLFSLDTKDQDYIVSFKFYLDSEEIEDIFVENIDRLNDDQIFNAHMYTNLLSRDLKAMCKAMLIIENDEDEEEEE